MSDNNIEAMRTKNELLYQENLNLKQALKEEKEKTTALTNEINQQLFALQHVLTGIANMLPFKEEK